MLLAGYMQTRDPEAWKQLEQRIFETPDRAASKQELQDVLESPGAKHFDSIFGDGAKNPPPSLPMKLPSLQPPSPADSARGNLQMMTEMAKPHPVVQTAPPTLDRPNLDPGKQVLQSKSPTAQKHRPRTRQHP